MERMSVIARCNHCRYGAEFRLYAEEVDDVTPTMHKILSQHVAASHPQTTLSPSQSFTIGGIKQ